MILFGVQYYEEMMQAELVAAEVARRAGLNKWGPTLSGVMKLPGYVALEWTRARASPAPGFLVASGATGM